MFKISSYFKLYNLLNPFNIVILISLILSGSNSQRLNCFRCISFSECSTGDEICSSARDYAKKMLLNYYYYEYKELQICPPVPEPGDKETLALWEEMKNSYPSSATCPESASGEATCSVGRFQIITSFSPSGKHDTDRVNTTSHGTILGCARRKLLQSTRESLAHQKSQYTCTMVDLSSSSYSLNTYSYQMRLEFCPTVTDMCHSSNYCVHPENSIVKTFKDHNYVPNIPIGIFIIFALILGVIICILTFAGIKYA